MLKFESTALGNRPDTNLFAHPVLIRGALEDSPAVLFNGFYRAVFGLVGARRLKVHVDVDAVFLELGDEVIELIQLNRIDLDVRLVSLPYHPVGIPRLLDVVEPDNIDP
jgi:hypothetical protein